MEQSRRTRLRDRAADQLLEMVISGGLEPGERLPPERELCGHLGVSRTVVREALNLLEARGLISIEHGRGAVVSGDSTHAVRDTLGLLLRVQPKVLWELLEIRRILEVEVPGLAAERARPDDVSAMRVQRGRRCASTSRRRRRTSRPPSAKGCSTPETSWRRRGYESKRAVGRAGVAR